MQKQSPLFFDDIIVAIQVGFSQEDNTICDL